MKKIIVIFVLQFLISIAFAQQYSWRVIATPRPGYPIYAVEFKDSLHGWCGAGDLLYRTTDGGYTWTTGSQPSFPNSFSDLSFVDSLLGWATGFFVGSGGFIWKTVDGGSTWSEQRLVYGRWYRGTAAQTELRNTTAGHTYQISFPDTGKLVTTSNGGSSWAEHTMADSITYLGQIQFVDSLHGWTYANYYSLIDSTSHRGLLHTTNGGFSWNLIESPVRYFSFVDTLNGFTYSGRDDNGLFVSRTRDGGLTWQTMYVPDASVYQDQFFPEAISFSDTGNGWLFGHTFYQGGLRAMIIWTSDGGYTWMLESIGVAGSLSDGLMVDEYHGWAVSYEGEVLGYVVMTDVVEHLPEIPLGFNLRQNYPNPFNNSTVIEYEIPTAADVTIAIYDGLGKLVRTLVRQHQPMGVFRIQLDEKTLSSGTYYYTMEARQQDGGQAVLYRKTKQLILLK